MNQELSQQVYLENIFGLHEWFNKLEVGKIAVPIRGRDSSIIEVRDPES